MKVKTTSQFDRAVKKYIKKHYPMQSLANCVDAIVANNKNFLRSHKDHKIGIVREIHINRQYNDDWLLIYRVNKNQLELFLINMGNHDSLNRMVN